MRKNKNNWKVLVSLGLLLPVLALACRAVIPGSVEAPSIAQPAITVVGEPLPAVESNPVDEPVHEQESMEGELPLVELYAKVNPSVVNITIYQEQNGELTGVGQGSGFVFDDQGYIVTNAHVVHGAEAVDVTFSDGTVLEGEIVGEDFNSDLAVVNVGELPAGVEPLTLGNMESLAVGQTVVAIGNPFGLAGTLTRGIISALGRTIPALTPFSIPQSIQTDAAINPGNSGGPLLNLQAEVIGVNAQIETGGTTRSNLGVGFAIPVSIVKIVVPDLIEKGAHEWAWLGVRGSDVTPILVEAMKLPEKRGAYFAEIVPDGPAAKAGLLGADENVAVDKRRIEIGGDVVLAIDGQPVSSFDDLLIYIALQTQPGQDVTITVLRDGKPIDVKVTLEERPAELTSLPTIP